MFAKYAMYKYTDAYKKMLSYAQAMDIDQPGYLDSFKSRTGRYIIGQDGEEIEFRPHRWFTKMVAKPEYQEEFMEIVPGDGWINTDENDDLLNKNFDTSYGMSYVPKRDIYDNSK
ncbi:hypothetical protein [Sharpea azabuensis]|uniref:hypothetical protein n=1 Tax=Sharpea azabuensis TaxID=322505 RepID=UPI00156965CC|nr:hypothetical protein [Sharpea azabuensis]